VRYEFDNLDYYPAKLLSSELMTGVYMILLIDIVKDDYQYY
jgi:hypothetical protein